MAADYAGACAAIKAKFVLEWADATPQAFINSGACVQKDTFGPIKWVLFEIAHAGTMVNGRGVPGNNIIIYDGLIKVHVFAPEGEGPEAALALAIAAGEIFRNQLFYDAETAGCYVRSGYDTTGQPRIGEGDITSDNGEWFVTTCTIPFEYWHRG